MGVDAVIELKVRVESVMDVEASYGSDALHGVQLDPLLYGVKVDKILLEFDYNKNKELKMLHQIMRLLLDNPSHTWKYISKHSVTLSKEEVIFLW